MIFARPGLGIGLATGPVVTSGLGIQEQIPSRKRPTGLKPFRGGKKRGFYVDRVRRPVPDAVDSLVPRAHKYAPPSHATSSHPTQQRPLDVTHLPERQPERLPDQTHRNPERKDKYNPERRPRS